MEGVRLEVLRPFERQYLPLSVIPAEAGTQRVALHDVCLRPYVSIWAAAGPDQALSRSCCAPSKQTPSSSRKRGPSAWHIDQSGDGRAGDEAHRERRRSAWILFQPSSEPRTQVRGRSNRLAATRNRRVPAFAGMTDLLIGFRARLRDASFPLGCGSKFSALSLTG